MDLPFYQNGVFLLIGLFFYLYSVLDGFDLGIGMWLPFEKGKEGAARLVSHIAPFWDGNEVWLVIGAGFVFGAFPAVLGLLLGTVYLPFLLFVAGLILRAIALEYSYHDLERQRRWHLVAAGGSFLVTLLGLFFLGSLLQGLPFEAAGKLSTRATDYIVAFPLFFSLSGLVVVLWHGATYALSRDPGEARQRVAKKLWWAVAVASIVLMGAWAVCLPQATRLPLALVGAGLYGAGVIAGRLTLTRKGWAFRFSCLMVTGLWLLILASLYPAVLPARHHPEWNLTLASASAPLSSLKILFVAGGVMVPIIAFYSYFMYRVFRTAEKVKDVQSP
jgi:cytochrome d ubiquinol oxidase subunit II